MDKMVNVTKELFPTAEKVSIDYAVMETSATEGLVYTHPAEFGWSDLGYWQSLHEKLQKDADNMHPLVMSASMSPRTTLSTWRTQSV